MVTSERAVRYVQVRGRLDDRIAGNCVFWPEGGGPGITSEALRQLEEYFRGERMAFNLPLDLRGTAFQRAVWQKTLEVPYGSTRAYSSIAKSLGMRGGARAVGSALASNPIPLVIPCHRVIRSDGSPGGYSPSPGLKVMLLEFERNNLRRVDRRQETSSSERIT